MKKKESKKTCIRIGVFAAKFKGHYQTEIITGIKNAAERFNIQIIYFCGYSLQSPHPYEESHNLVYESAIHASLDGLIIFPILANFCDNNVLNDFFSRYKNIPVVNLHHHSPLGNTILSNNASGFIDLIKHLIEEHQYKKIAFVKGPEFSFNAQERYKIYKSTLSAAGLPIDPALIVEGSYRYHSGSEAIEEFFDKRGLELGKDIEVIICANDTMAIGVIDELNRRGLHVPEDVAVTGYDNVEESLSPKASLTTVKQHLREIGDRAVCTLLDYKPHQDPEYFDTDLIIRQSCGCPQANEKEGDADADLNRRSNHSENIKPDVHKLYLEFTFQEIYTSLNSLKIIGQLSELTPWMKGHLPGLGINCAWIFIITDISSDISTYKCIAGYDLQEPEKEEPFKEIKENVIFDDFLSQKQDRSFSVQPLLFKDEKYGLMVTEVNELAYPAYEIISHYIGSTIKNTLLGEEVMAKNQEILKLSEQKTQFFINIAHETRTPLTLIQNYLDIYMKQHEADDSLLVIKENIDLLVRNMINFLDAEKLQKGEIIYHHDSFVDLSKSAREKYAIFQAVAIKKKIQIKLNIKEQLIIKIDPWALDRIFNNLLDNAVKYIPVGGEIVIEVWREAKKAMLSISDNGPGLASDSFVHIFEPYYQLSRRKVENQGIGIGLSIIKKIIDSMGAELNLKNKEEGGLCFTISFEDYSSEKDKKLWNLPDTKPGSIIFQTKIQEQKIQLNKHSLLIVDDNMQLLKFLQAALEESYNLYLARSVTEALAKLNSAPRIDLIISDIMMDELDGYQFLISIFEEKKFSNIPFIFLTALNTEKERIKGLGLGAVDYIEKPFSIEALKNKIKSIISLRRRQVEKDLRNFHSKIDEIYYGSHNAVNDFKQNSFEQFCINYKIIGREKEIAQMIMNGVVHKEIALNLNLSLSAVEYHITKLYKKCDVNNKYDLLKKIWD